VSLFVFCCAIGSVHNDDSLIVFFSQKEEVGMVNKSKSDDLGSVVDWFKLRLKRPTGLCILRVISRRGRHPQPIVIASLRE